VGDRGGYDIWVFCPIKLMRWYPLLKLRPDVYSLLWDKNASRKVKMGDDRNRECFTCGLGGLRGDWPFRTIGLMVF